MLCSSDTIFHYLLQLLSLVLMSTFLAQFGWYPLSSRQFAWSTSGVDLWRHMSCLYAIFYSSVCWSYCKTCFRSLSHVLSHVLSPGLIAAVLDKHKLNLKIIYTQKKKIARTLNETNSKVELLQASKFSHLCVKCRLYLTDECRQSQSSLKIHGNLDEFRTKTSTLWAYFDTALS